MADSTVTAGEAQQDSIPKVIHYCWFGMKPHPAFVVKCMDSWRRVLPDYRIVEWNETNTDLDANAYVREAYDAGKYAFVTDYVRLKVLHEHGGIYMDTDVEVVKRLDAFLQHDAFSGFEGDASIPTAVLGSRAGNEWIQALLGEYQHLHFTLANGTSDVTTNVTRITRYTSDHYSVLMDNSFQEIPGVLTLYPTDRFCPQDYETGIINRTPNTYAIHHFAGTWVRADRRESRAARVKLNRLFGTRLGGTLSAVRRLVVAALALPGRVVRGLRRRISASMTRAAQQSEGAQRD